MIRIQLYCRICKKQVGLVPAKAGDTVPQDPMCADCKENYKPLRQPNRHGYIPKDPDSHG